jgi:diadenosine tetraphosphate (Ap4A) HIT family hydrolase
MKSECPLCEQLTENDANSRFICRFTSGTLFVGHHQYFPGYTIFVSATHVREMHLLTEEQVLDLWKDLNRISKAVSESFKPMKLNLVSLGNINEHLHWHIMPRYDNEPFPRDHPWREEAEFRHFPTTPEMVQRIRLKLNF